MSKDDFFEAIVKGETWFNNGSTRNRHVVSLDGIFVLYQTESNKNKVTGVLVDNFAKWAKGTGKVGQMKDGE